jgi:hypothetical protein
MMTGRRGGLLRQRNIRLFWTGESLSEVGNSVAVFAGAGSRVGEDACAWVSGRNLILDLTCEDEGLDWVPAGLVG